MATYVVNKNAQLNGDHEVHNKTNPCSSMPDLLSQIALGEHSNCSSAVNKAKEILGAQKRVNGCKFCANACHTS